MEHDDAPSLCDAETGEVYVGCAQERAPRLAAELRATALQARLREMQAGDPSPRDGTPA